MATDPTRRIREKDFEGALIVEAKTIAERLADLEPSPKVPYLTVTLDWRVEGTNPGRAPDEQHPDNAQNQRRRSEPDRSEEEAGEASARRRPARREFDDQVDALIEGFADNEDARESLEKDAERVREYLDGEVDPSARGVYIVANHSLGVFEPVMFGLPLPTSLTTAPTPVLTELVRLDEDYPSYAVLLADQQEAHLAVISHGTTDHTVVFEGSGYPRKQQQGGWSQRRFQARADERVEAFARDVAEKTREVFAEHNISSLVLAGDEVIMSALENDMHETVSDKVVGKVRLDIDTSEHELVEATMPIAVKAERQRERDTVQQASDGIGADTYGTGGGHRVLEAMQAGQVETLVMNDDFSEPGWADFGMPAFGAGDLPTTHPLGGEVGDLVPVELRDELVRQAVLTGAKVEIVHSESSLDAEDLEEVPDAGEGIPRSRAATALDAHGGVAAILRYVIGDEPSEEESAAQAQA